MSLYKGNNLISGVMPNSANQSLSNLDSAGQDIIDNKANTNLSNLTATSSTNFDGQWVSSQYTIASSVSVNGSTSLEYSLSSYLPNDSYDYEVFFDGYAATGNASGNSCPLVISLDNSVGGAICRVVTRANAISDTAGCAIFPVGTSRKIYVARGTNYNGNITLRAMAYRRIGTNN